VRLQLGRIKFDRVATVSVDFRWAGDGKWGFACASKLHTVMFLVGAYIPVYLDSAYAVSALISKDAYGFYD
jgi:hypothetical protein